MASSVVCRLSSSVVFWHRTRSNGCQQLEIARVSNGGQVRGGVGAMNACRPRGFFIWFHRCLPLGAFKPRASVQTPCFQEQMITDVPMVTDVSTNESQM